MVDFQTVKNLVVVFNLVKLIKTNFFFFYTNANKVGNIYCKTILES